MPEKLEKCVADVKAQGKSDDSAWGICVDSTGEKPHKEVKEDHTHHNVPSKLDISFDDRERKTNEGIDNNSANDSIKAEIVEAIFQEKINANRQVPLFNPPITNRKIEPDIQKTTKGIGGQVGKIDSDANTNNMTTDLWKKILDTQLRRNVKEPRY